MLNKIALGLVLWLGSAALVAAQSNALVDQLLDQSPATLGLTSYLILASTGQVAPDADPAAAFEAAQAARWIPAKAAAEDPVTIETLSFLVMKAKKVGGGVMWTLLPSPRGAFNELVFLGIVPPGNPARPVAGDEVIRVLNDVVELKGAK